MFKSIILFVNIVIVCQYFVHSVVQNNEFEENIYFNFYKNNSIVHRTNSFNEDLSQFCDSSQPWAIIVHGWKELACNAIWVPQLIEKLTSYRGGCIVCMDYYAYSQGTDVPSYLNLTSKFDNISDVLLKKLTQFENNHFDPTIGFMFGFSFGGQLVINAGRDFGGKLAAIDACEPAGPEFYPNPVYQARGSPKLAAKNVQTIHTSTDLGTLERDSHQDWLMGDCGVDQPGAQVETIQILFITVETSKKNHIMCPTFYVNAFENKFLAVQNDNCESSTRNVLPVPANFRMGYVQDDKELVQGTLYAYTYKNAPYNLPAAGESYSFYD